ncbi:MAG: Ig-like domain-containing protein, partial [Dehalococcoidia bacterium]
MRRELMIALLVIKLTLVMTCILVIPFNQVMAEEDTSEVTAFVWTLPDEVASSPGTQIIPNPGASQPLTYWVASSGEYPENQSFTVNIYYPDGSSRSSIAAVAVIDPSEIEQSTSEAVNAGLISQEYADLCLSGTISLWRAVDELEYHETPGHYRLETVITSQTGEISHNVVNTFEYRGIKAFELGFDSLDFGRVTPGESAYVNENADGEPAITNTGNIPLLVSVSAAPMTGASTDQELRYFSSRLLGEEVHFEADEVIKFASPLLSPATAAMGFSVYAPEGQAADVYTGDMAITTSAFPTPQVNIIEPVEAQTWSPGETHTINWETTDPSGAGLRASIWFSPDGGNSWPVLIAMNIDDTGVFDWTIPDNPDLISAEARLRVVVTDQSGLYGEDLTGITITPLNSAPAAFNDSYTVDQDHTLTVAAPGVLQNDSDLDGDSLIASLQTGVASGSLSFNTDGSFMYVPTPGYTGPD